ncbi:MAG: hypothetical protein M3R38_04405 [Actinomycetota bacterium]|nr:hypothetical protein [Actinomycetota bacterium]MDP9484318.1 hypothetical protein [Actinomycetota bacterium]
MTEKLDMTETKGVGTQTEERTMGHEIVVRDGVGYGEGVEVRTIPARGVRLVVEFRENGRSGECTRVTRCDTDSSGLADECLEPAERAAPDGEGRGRNTFEIAEDGVYVAVGSGFPYTPAHVAFRVAGDFVSILSSEREMSYVRREALQNVLRGW